MTHALSNYLIDKDPNHYGGKQEEYLAFAEETINQGVGTLSSGIKEGKDPSELFFKILKLFQKNRNQIAHQHKTQKAELFGTPRTKKNTPGAGLALTPLFGNYESYNTLIKRCLYPILSSMDHDLQGFKESSATKKEKAQDRIFKLQIEIKQGEKELKAWCPPPEKELQKALQTYKSTLEIQNNLDLSRRLKKEYPEWYKQFTIFRTIMTMRDMFPSPKILSFEEGKYEGNTDNLKNIYMVATLRIEINRKLYALSRYITWLYTDYRTDPVERMLERSKVFIVHQDIFLIDETLQEIAKIFAQAVNWNSQTQKLTELKQTVALMRFLFAHCMPSARGDGAIGDWLEHTLYRYHGFANTRHNQNKLPCFEVFIPSLKTYLENYDQTITVE